MVVTYGLMGEVYCSYCNAYSESRCDGYAKVAVLGMEPLLWWMCCGCSAGSIQ